MRIPLLVRCALALSLNTLLSGANTPIMSPAPARQIQTEAASETVANLAAGRVAILVCKDGIVVATAESRVEPDTLPPMIVPLSAFRVGVVLGPIEWIFPGSGRGPLRLDVELRRAGSLAAPQKASKESNPASDIETIGLAFLGPLRDAAARIHSRLRLERKEMFTELLLAGYAPDYGPEVWSLRYRVEQQLLRGEFYQTVVHRPEYVQLYPPEKGQPRTLVESHYPPEDASDPPLAELLAGHDARITALRNADAGLDRAAGFLEKGESQKVFFVDGLEFVRAVMQGVIPRDRRQMIATIRQDKGVEWVAGAELAGPAIPREKGAPGAPSLYKQPKPPR